MSSKAKKCRPTARDKGRIVEQVVAAMHESPGVTVRRNVRVPVVGVSKRRREIDVLVTGDVTGYPVRIAVECKNVGRAVGAPGIDAFVGKLKDIGIPPQCGIYVSATGYTRGAIDRASEAGLRTLTLAGLTKERIASEVSAAIQSVVYVMLDVRSLSVENEVASSNEPWTMFIFHDAEGNVVGSLPDLVWQEWVAGRVSETLGEHTVEIPLDQGWSIVSEGVRHVCGKASAVVSVVGIVVQIPGAVQRHVLMDAADGSVTKATAHASFEQDAGSYQVHTVTTEDDLKAVVGGDATLQLEIGKIRLPRIRLSSMYWPVSERVGSMIASKMQAFLAGEIPDPRPFRFEDVEGTALATVWEPVWAGHPSVRGTV